MFAGMLHRVTWASDTGVNKETISNSLVGTNTMGDTSGYRTSWTGE